MTVERAMYLEQSIGRERSMATKCTGFENTGTCWWCGDPLLSRHYRYCQKGHREEYHRHFFWTEAREWALERADHRCEKCGRASYQPAGAPPDRLEVHHITPLNGENRACHPLNRPGNLQALCLDCHNETKGRKPLESVEQLAFDLGPEDQYWIAL